MEIMATNKRMYESVIGLPELDKAIDVFTSILKDVVEENKQTEVSNQYLKDKMSLRTITWGWRKRKRVRKRWI